LTLFDADGLSGRPAPSCCPAGRQRLRRLLLGLLFTLRARQPAGRGTSCAEGISALSSVRMSWFRLYA
jgi:hypothetical protein